MNENNSNNSAARETGLSPEATQILNDLRNGELSFWECEATAELVSAGLVVVEATETQTDPDTEEPLTLLRLAVVGQKVQATVYHEIRQKRIFLCIATIGNDPLEASRACYDVERELPADVKPGTIAMLVAEMENESGLSLRLSEILKEEMGVS